jgi:hypothetical protein
MVDSYIKNFDRQTAYYENINSYHLPVCDIIDSFFLWIVFEYLTWNQKSEEKRKKEKKPVIFKLPFFLLCFYYSKIINSSSKFVKCFETV